MTQPVIFISYNHKDEREKDRLLSHLGVLQREGLISLWSDDRIGAGADWKQEISQTMAQARVAILLITANFLTSDFILGKEVPPLLKRRQSEGLIVFPVIAKACAWQQVDWLTEINVRPKNGKPIWGGSRRVDEDLAAIANEVAAIVKTVPPITPTSSSVPGKSQRAKKYKAESRATSNQKYSAPLAWNQEPSILVIGHRLDADVECVLWSETEPNVVDYDIVIMDLTIERKPLLLSYRPRQIRDPQFDISNYLTWTHTRNRIESLILSGGTIFIIADSSIVRHLDAPRKSFPDENGSLLPFVIYGEQTPAGKSISFVDPQFGFYFHNLGTWNFIFNGHIDLNFESTSNHTGKIYPIARNKAKEILGISIRVDSHKSSKSGWIHVLPKPTSITSFESTKLLVMNLSK